MIAGIFSKQSQKKKVSNHSWCNLGVMGKLLRSLKMFWDLHDTVVFRWPALSALKEELLTVLKWVRKYTVSEFSSELIINKHYRSPFPPSQTWRLKNACTSQDHLCETLQIYTEDRHSLLFLKSKLD